MPDIHLLDNSTIDKIAAGEVVENPASIVKELVENSMDSKATSITVEIKQGGIEYIRVTDNGIGISKDNIQKAFLRHATSKINSIDDLFLIKSMGFRGEALASISSVSKVELISKTDSSLMGNRYVIEGSKEMEFEEIGAPKGTSIIVRNLFYNTPARRKFLKSEGTEGGYVSDVIQSLALCRPDISFNYIINGKTKLSTSGNNDLKEIIYRLYGREIVNEIIPIESDSEGIKVKGFLGAPSQNRATRNYETYFINNRLIKSKDIFSSIEEGYKAYTMQHKFPFCVLHFSIDTNEIDINVHPQKKEVRFLNKENLQNFISSSVANTLNQEEMIKEVKLVDTMQTQALKISNPEPFEQRRINEFNNENSKFADSLQRKQINELNSEISSDSTSEDKDYIEDIIVFDEDIESEDIVFEKSFKTDNDTVNKENTNTDPNNSAAILIENQLMYDNIVIDKPEQLDLFNQEKFISENSRRQYKIIGQIFNTYWIIELKDKIYFVDQHAAHEKVNYERLIKRVNENRIESQYLNPPIIITLTPNEKSILQENINYFNELGFEIDDMGFNEIGLSATPLELYFNNSKEMLDDILAELSRFGKKENPDAITKRIATMACKASVKGGMSMTVNEIEVLLDELLTLDNPYHCPHGRPTLFSMSQYELEKKFKRIVD